jgi:hypothetical protein
MTLYHFTSLKHIRGCLAEGLTKGHVPTQLEPPELASGWQWLTTDESFQQSWNTMTNLDYDRTAYRITITLPYYAAGKVYRWEKKGPKLCKRSTYETLSSQGDPENWRLFKGTLHPQWMVDVTAKEGHPAIEIPTSAK